MNSKLNHILGCLGRLNRHITKSCCPIGAHLWRDCRLLWSRPQFALLPQGAKVLSRWRGGRWQGPMWCWLLVIEKKSKFGWRVYTDVTVTVPIVSLTYCSLEVSDQCELCQSPSRSSTAHRIKTPIQSSTSKPFFLYTCTDMAAWLTRTTNYTKLYSPGPLGAIQLNDIFYEKNEKNIKIERIWQNEKHKTQPKKPSQLNMFIKKRTHLLTYLPIYTYCGVFF